MMKKWIHHISCVAICIMVMVLCPVCISHAEQSQDETIPEHRITNVEDLKQYVQSKKKIKCILDTDISLDEKLAIGTDDYFDRRDIVLDLNGHSISEGGNGYIYVAEYVSLEIMDSSEGAKGIISKKLSEQDLYDYHDKKIATITSKGQLKLNDVSVSVERTGTYKNEKPLSEVYVYTYAIYLDNPGTCEVNNSKILVKNDVQADKSFAFSSEGIYCGPFSGSVTIDNSTINIQESTTGGTQLYPIKASCSAIYLDRSKGVISNSDISVLKENKSIIGQVYLAGIGDAKDFNSGSMELQNVNVNVTNKAPIAANILGVGADSCTMQSGCIQVTSTHDGEEIYSRGDASMRGVEAGLTMKSGTIQLTADHEKDARRNNVIPMVGVGGGAFIESGTIKIDASSDELSGIGISGGNIVLGIDDGVMDRTTPCIDAGLGAPLRCGNHLIMYDGSITGCSEKQYEPEELEEGYAICNVDWTVNREKDYRNGDWGERLSYSQYVYNNSFLAKEDIDKKYNAIYDWKEWDETGKDKIPYTCKVKLTDPDDKDITFTHMCEVEAVETRKATCVQPRLVTYTAKYGKYTDELKKDYEKDKWNHIHTEVRDDIVFDSEGDRHGDNTYCLDCGKIVEYGHYLGGVDSGDDKSDTSEYPNPVIKPGVTVPATTTQASIVSTGTVVVKGVGTEIKVPGTNGTFKVTNASATFEVVYVAPDNKTVAGIAIPETITSDGVTYKVTSIAPNAFKGCKKLKKVTIPAGITSIGAKAFYGCKNLKNITVKSTSLNKIGKKAFAKIHAKAKVKVPKAKKAAYKKLFKKAGLSGKGQKIK